jgi:hypothetical protein
MIMEKLEKGLRRIATELPENPLACLAEFLYEPVITKYQRAAVPLQVFQSETINIQFRDEFRESSETPIHEDLRSESDQVFSFYLTDLANSVRRATT